MNQIIRTQLLVLVAVAAAAPRILQAQCDLGALWVRLETSRCEGCTIRFARYPTPSYDAAWTQWGKGLVASNGRVYSGVGDHRGIDGNSYLYEYDPGTQTLRAIAHLQQAVPVPTGEYGFGKIHGRISEGRDGNLYFASFHGKFGDEGRGSTQYLFKYDLHSRRIEKLVGLQGYGFPSTEMWGDGLLFYAQATDADERNAIFLVYDISARRVVFQTPQGYDGSRAIFVDREGNAYANTADRHLFKYDPRLNELSMLDVQMPATALRQTIGPGPSGCMYGFNRDTFDLFRFDPESSTITGLCLLESDAASIELDPSGRYVYYIPWGGDGQPGQLCRLDVSDPARVVHQQIADVARHIANKYGMQLQSSYNLTMSRDGGTLYLGFNADRSVGFIEIRLPAASSSTQPAVDTRPAYGGASPAVPGQTHAVTTAPTRPADGDADERFRQLQARYADQPWMRALEGRMSAVDDLLDQTKARGADLRAQALQQQLSAVLGLPAPRPAPGPGPQQIAERATGKLQAVSLPSDLPAEEAALVSSYYDDRLNRRQADLLPDARMTYILGGRSACEACVLTMLPGLILAEPGMFTKGLNSSPTWLVRPDVLPQYELLAMRLARTSTAFEVNQFTAGVGQGARGPDDGRKDRLAGGQGNASAASATQEAPPLAFMQYLKDAADVRQLVGQYSEAIRLLQLARDEAESHHADKAIADLGLAIAGLREKTKQYPLAAAEFGTIAKLTTDPQVCARAALGQLRCMYADGAYSSAADHAQEYLSYSQLEPWQPQILYAAWAAASSIGDSGRGRRLAERFLRCFPDHPLGGDINFSLAVQAIAESENGQARVFLDAVLRHGDVALRARASRMIEEIDGRQSNKASR